MEGSPPLFLLLREEAGPISNRPGRTHTTADILSQGLVVIVVVVVMVMVLVVVMMMLLIPPPGVMMVMVMVMVVVVVMMVVVVVVNELHVRIPARTLAGGRRCGRVRDPQEGEGVGYGVE